MHPGVADPIRVLHVDDEESVRRLVTEVLERASTAFEVVGAQDAREGLEILAGGDVDCVLSDYDMPGMDGVAFLQAVRDRDETLPFVLLTGVGTEAVAGAALRSGATDYLIKDRDAYRTLPGRIASLVAAARSERHARDAKRRLHALVGHSADLITVVDDAGITRYHSPSVERILGYDPTALLGTPIADLVVPADLPVVERTLERLVSETDGSVGPVEFRARHADGGVRWIEAVWSDHVDDPAIGGYVVNSRDVTERREREEQLALRSAALDSAGDGIAILDADGTIRHANAAYAAVHGFADVDDLVGTDIEDRYLSGDASLPGDASLFDASVFAAVESEGHWRGDLVGVTRDGDTFDQETTLTAIDDDAVVCIVRDVTERKRQDRTLAALHEASLALSEARRPEAVAEVAVDVATRVLDLPAAGIWLADDAGRLEPVALVPAPSPFESDDHPDDHVWWSYQSDETRVFRPSSTAATLPDGGPAVREELVVPLGPYGVLRVGSDGEEGFDRSSRRFAETLAATTEAALGRAEREERLATQRGELERQNERLDEFASVVSHDLRNPLTIAQGNLYLIGRDPAVDRTHIENVQYALDRMEALIEDVLRLARNGRTVDDPEPVAFEAVVENAWKTVDAEEARLLNDYEGVVVADPGRLEQLLVNLFRNAVEHGSTSPDSNARQDAVEHGGEAVTVRVERVEGGFAVADDGPGIPAEDRETVFDSGYSTNEDGTGFGLAIVGRIAEAHGWTVALTESPTGGARFVFTDVESGI